jgi:hypothetical protein
MVDYPIVYQTTSGLSIGQRIDKPMDFGGAHLFKTSPLGLYPFFTAIKWEKNRSTFYNGDVYGCGLHGNH